MIRAPWLFIAAAAAWGHAVSMSSADLTIEGTHARYELRMPLYETQHVPAPERTLLEHVGFSGGRLVSSECRADTGRDLYICRAEYEFAAPVSQVDAECTLPAITVPNHVHLLRVAMGEKHDQAVFDVSFPRATLRFRPPTAAEVAVSEAAAGMMRALGGAVQVLFLAALAIAARNRREWFAIVAMFLAGQAAAVFGMPHVSWQPAPRFVEAAAALAVAYLAVEVLMLPKAGSRWLIAGVLGVLHGFYFHLFLLTSEYHAVWVLAGAFAAELVLLTAFAFFFARVARFAAALRPVPVAASALLVFGMVWFILRLRS